LSIRRRDVFNSLRAVRERKSGLIGITPPDCFDKAEIYGVSRRYSTVLSWRFWLLIGARGYSLALP
jgi:hypothetical protein